MKQITSTNNVSHSLALIHVPPPTDTHTHATFKLNLSALDQIRNEYQIKNKIPQLGSNKPDFNPDYPDNFPKPVPLHNQWEMSKPTTGKVSLGHHT